MKCVLKGPWAKDDNGSYFKAALLSGSPGIGKCKLYTIIYFYIYFFNVYEHLFITI